MIDSHSHIYSDAFDADRQQVVERALQAGVTHVVLPNENLASLTRIRQMKLDYPQFVSMSIGLHPEEINDDFREQLSAMNAILEQQHKQFVAIGEIGIDLYWDRTWRNEQIIALTEQLRWCHTFNIPFIIHCREGIDEIISVLSSLTHPVPRGVFHSFTGTAHDITRLRAIGDFYFGVNGIVTFKNSNVRELLPIIGLNRILVETDAPYLAPVPHRGKRNEPAFVAHVVNFIASQLGVSPHEVAQTTANNAATLFSLH